VSRFIMLIIVIHHIRSMYVRKRFVATFLPNAALFLCRLRLCANLNFPGSLTVLVQNDYRFAQLFSKAFSRCPSRRIGTGYFAETE